MVLRPSCTAASRRHKGGGRRRFGQPSQGALYRSLETAARPQRAGEEDQRVPRFHNLFLIKSDLILHEGSDSLEISSHPSQSSSGMAAWWQSRIIIWIGRGCMLHRTRHVAAHPTPIEPQGHSESQVKTEDVETRSCEEQAGEGSTEGGRGDG